MGRDGLARHEVVLRNGILTTASGIATPRRHNPLKTPKEIRYGKE